MFVDSPWGGLCETPVPTKGSASTSVSYSIGGQLGLAARRLVDASPTSRHWSKCIAAETFQLHLTEMHSVNSDTIKSTFPFFFFSQFGAACRTSPSV